MRTLVLTLVPVGVGAIAWHSQPRLRSSVGSWQHSAQQRLQGAQHKVEEAIGSKEPEKPKPQKKKFGSLF